MKKASEQCFQPLLLPENKKKKKKKKTAQENRNLSAGLDDKQLDSGNE